MSVLDPAIHPIETATALTIEGRFHHLFGQHRKAATLFERAAPLARPPADGSPMSPLHASTLTQVMAYTAGAYQHLGLWDDADRWARRVIEVGEKHNILLAQAVGYEFRGENACGSGAWASALDFAERERAIAGRLHSRERVAWVHMYSGFALLQLGEIKRAHAELEAGLALAESIGERRLALILLAYVAVAEGRLGDLDKALAAAAVAVERADAANLLYMRTEARRCLGELLISAGRHQEAVARFEEVLELTAPTDARISRLWTGPPHVEALLALGRREEARSRFDVYATLVAECQSPWFTKESSRLAKLF